MNELKFIIFLPQKLFEGLTAQQATHRNSCLTASCQLIIHNYLL